MRVARSPDSDPTSDLSSCFLLWQASPRITIVTAFLNSSPTLRTYLLGDEGSLRPSVSTRRTHESERSQSHDREIYRGKGGIMKEQLIVLENYEKVPELVMNRPGRLTMNNDNDDDGTIRWYFRGL